LNGRAGSLLRPNSKKQNNTALIRDADLVNVTIREQTDNGTAVERAHIDLVTLSSNPGSYNNALGYYYYKTGTQLNAGDLRALPKYLAFPKLVAGKPEPGLRVRLQFFGENSDQPGTDEFPSGYTIGWCLIANIEYGIDIEQIHANIGPACEKKKIVYSNYFVENQVRPGFITLLDETSGKLVLGIEDSAFQEHYVGPSDNSYEDMLFYIDADPIGAITGGEIPVIEPEEVISTETTTGILAFEDIWPSGGDYDMNDEVVSYSTVISYNQDNEVKKVADSFTFIHDGADFKNAFGYVINNQVGTIDEAASNYSVKEENNQFIFCENTKNAQNQTFVLTRVFEEGNYPDKASYSRDYNPFIAVNYQAGIKDRVEVHLPKYPATAWADQHQVTNGENAYFIDNSGNYPFAIDLPVTTFKVPVEALQDGIKYAYSKFESWVQSNGTVDADWYLYPNAEYVQE